MSTLEAIDMYLSEEQKREIAEEVFRDRVKEALASDRQVTNYLYDMTQHLINEALTENVGGWKHKVIEHTKGALSNDKISFYLFRKADAWGAENGPAISYMREAVDKHAERIEARVIKAIDGMDDEHLGDMLRGALARQLGGGA